MSDQTTGVPDEKVKDTQEEFENQSQLNANDAADAEYGWKANRKRTYDEYQDIALTAARRSQNHADDLNSRTLNSFDSLLTLQNKLNNEHFTTISELRHRLATLEADRARYADDAEYVTRYDLSNPVTTGTGDALRSAAYPPNRFADVGGAVGTVSLNDAVANLVTALTATVVAAAGKAAGTSTP